MRILALSPHLDDAAFSAGATLTTLSSAGHAVTVLTAFTASMPDPRGFALACQLDKGLPPDADYMALRRAEDMAACAALGARPVHLPLPEAPHRGYGSAAALFAGVHDEDRIDLALADALAPHVERADLILTCQAIGAHVDHLQLLRALDRLARRPTLWWRDHPYAARAGAAPLAVRFDALPEVAAPITPTAAAARAAACHAYATQLGFQFGGPDGLDAHLAALPEERFRASDAALAVAVLPNARRRA